MIERILKQLKQQLEQSTQQLTLAQVDGAESGNNDNETIRGFRYAMARVREAIEALTRRFGEWFITNPLFRQIGLVIAAQICILMFFETKKFSSFSQKDVNKFVNQANQLLQGQMKQMKRVSMLAGILIEGDLSSSRQEIDTVLQKNPHIKVLIVFQQCKGGDNIHCNIYLLDPRSPIEPFASFFNFSPNKATKGGGDLTPTLRRVVSKIVGFLKSKQM